MNAEKQEVIDATLASTLDSLDEAVNYRAWIVDLARPHLSTPILEVGAGHGTFTESLVRHGAVTALEPGDHAFAMLQTRFAANEFVSVQHGTLEHVSPDPAFGSAVMINVLEHIEDDSDALRQIARRLVPGGRLVIWVPAFELLFSDFDRKLGHHRRYRRRQLLDVVESAGYEVLEAKYVNLPGWFSWLIITRLLRQQPTAGPMVRVFDRFLVPAIRRVESWTRVPFGQSVFLVARPRSEQ